MNNNKQVMIKAGIIGGTGYAGSELIRLLSGHGAVSIKTVTSRSYTGERYGRIFENYRHLDELVCEEERIEEMADECDVIFLALPHGVAGKKITEDILSRTKVIDLGADFRLSDAEVYEEWYGVNHEAKNLLSEAVYGLPEINREQVKGRRLVANPGCYPTCGILSLYPIVKEGIIDNKSIIIDAKSGVSGAGRAVSTDVHFCEVNESVKAYKIGSHRHTPEIEQQISEAAGEQVTLSFTPHLIPMSRGILATCYGVLKKDYTYSQIRDIYNDYYGGEFFIRLTEQNIFPQTKWVKGSNFCDIGFTIDERTGRIIVVGAIDNLVKGAAGQAVQNMNILFGLDEKKGISGIPCFPI